MRWVRSWHSHSYLKLIHIQKTGRCLFGADFGPTIAHVNSANMTVNFVTFWLRFINVTEFVFVIRNTMRRHLSLAPHKITQNLLSPNRFEFQTYMRTVSLETNMIITKQTKVHYRRGYQFIFTLQTHLTYERMQMLLQTLLIIY